MTRLLANSTNCLLSESVGKIVDRLKAMANVTKETIFARRHQMHFILHPIHVTNERGRMEKGFD